MNIHLRKFSIIIYPQGPFFGAVFPVSEESVRSQRGAMWSHVQAMLHVSENLA